VDRGLFQLNSDSFPNLAEPDFFDPLVNAHYGLAHLRWCIDAGGSEIAGLAMYNAGTGRVRSGATPKVTLDYVSRILENRWKIEELFFAWDNLKKPPASATPVEKPSPPLLGLSGRP
jgi:soluble lytic murein transglycosylase-like protein